MLRHGEIVEEAPTAANHPWPHAHLRFEGTGRAPYQPTTPAAWPYPVIGTVTAGGGTAEANSPRREDKLIRGG
jgi:hypothetical protein